MALWQALPWILGALALLKVAAAAWIATPAQRQRVLTDRTILLGAASWLTAVLALYGVLVWLVDAGSLIPRYFVLLVAILAIPLARVSAATLALDWNRHR